LTEGVTPLEMAYAYSTLANDGVRVSGDLAPGDTGPVAIQSVEEDGKVTENHKVEKRVLPAKVAQLEKDMLGLVVSSGTGKAAQVGGDEFIWGKTGTTENYGDAWFVGGNDDLTVAIWVGYADKLQPMEYEHAGGPVAGGTFPAEIFHDFMTSWLEMRGQRRLERGANKDDETDGVSPAIPIAPSDVPPAEQAAPAAPEADEQDQGGTGGGAEGQPEPQNPAPEPEPAPTPAPGPTQPPSGGGGDGGGVSPGGTP
jgi:penicillin-binding protein 1A